MVKGTNLINSFTSSLNTAGLCSLFGWANPKAAAAGQLANNVTNIVLDPIKNLFWIPSEPEAKQWTLSQIVVNGALIFGTAAATAYAANYVGRQIDPNYNYLNLLWPQFKVSAAIGVGVGLTEAVITAAINGQKTEKEAKEGETKNIPLIVTPALQDALLGATLFDGASAILGIRVSRNPELLAAGLGFIFAGAMRMYRESQARQQEQAAQVVAK